MLFIPVKQWAKYPCAFSEFPFGEELAKEPKGSFRKIKSCSVVLLLGIWLFRES